MFYLKLNDDMSLGITVRDTIYRGENLRNKLIFLIPKVVGEADTLTTIAYLSYIRADGVADVVVLTRMDAMYKEEYYQYTLPIDSKFTQFPGEVCTWLQFYSGTPSAPVIARSSECVLHVNESKSVEAYLHENQLTALYQLQKTLDEEISNVAENSVDNISYDDITHLIRLKSGEKDIGDAIEVPGKKYAEEIERMLDDEWLDIEDDSDGASEWEDM